MTGRIVRFGTPCALVGLLAAAAGGCGNDEIAAPSTIAQTSTTYVTVPARSTTTTAAPRPSAANESGGDDGDTGGETESSAADDPDQERIHEIQSGDYLLGIASDYDVPINYVPEYNGWTDGLGHALVPGQEVRIPPADWSPEGEGGDTTTAETDESSPDSGSAPECEDGSAGETYRITSGDTPARVASEHGVTVEELNAANANTRYYGGFVVGITINIPC